MIDFDKIIKSFATSAPIKGGKARQRRFAIRPSRRRVSQLSIINLVIHNGWSYAETARGLGCSKQYVGQVIRRYRAEHPDPP